MGGEIYDGIVSSKYAELFKELNILSKDMDITLLSNELIKNKIESIKSHDGSIKFKDIKLIIGNGSNNEDNLSFIISGKYLGINIDETTIKISNLYNYHFPNDNTYYKLSSDIELSNNFIIDLKNQDDIKNISETEILKYLKPFTVFERNNSFNSLEIIPSKFKSIKLEFEEQNYSIKKITGTYEKITYKVNNSWEKENIETTFVDKTILYFENFLLKFFDIQDILNIIIDNFTSIDYEQIKNVFPSKLNSDISVSPTQLPLSIQGDKLDIIAQKYFNNNHTFIFTYDGDSQANDIDGVLNFSYSVYNEGYQNIVVSKNIEINNMQSFNNVYNGEILDFKGNSSLIREKYTNAISESIKNDKTDLISKINSLKDGQELELDNFNNNFFEFIKKNSLISPGDQILNGDDLNLMFLSKNLNNDTWNESTNIFDNSFLLDKIQIDIDKSKQFIIRDSNGFKYIMRTQYKIIVYNQEILINCEFFGKLNLSNEIIQN